MFYFKKKKVKIIFLFLTIYINSSFSILENKVSSINYSKCNKSIVIDCNINHFVKYNENVTINWFFNNYPLLKKNNTNTQKLILDFSKYLYGNYTCYVINNNNILLKETIQLKYIIKWLNKKEINTVVILLSIYVIILWGKIIATTIKFKLSFKKDKKIIYLYYYIGFVITLIMLLGQYMIGLNTNNILIRILGTSFIQLSIFISIILQIIFFKKKFKNTLSLITVFLLHFISYIISLIMFTMSLIGCYNEIYGKVIVYKLLLVIIFEFISLLSLFIFSLNTSIKYRKLHIIEDENLLFSIE
ncbi:CD47-like putative membrane protein [Goatpox virus]|uniref:Leukocyte surface antigen CD47 n=2 Tax=Goatpox virus TaxID=186805 RepID=A0A2Z4XFY2_9POXV|nr:CD47-like protein [Goatpox virus FZ]AXA19889.1 CD47-like protein [Goatpox virus]QEJ78978.1 CD47-like putative membrane protein [Goatpox virus]